MPNPLDIAIITAFTGGGAGAAAVRCHNGLLKLGQRSCLLSQSEPIGVTESRRISSLTEIGSLERLVWERIFDSQKHMGKVASIPYPGASYPFLRQLCDYDVVHLHWVSGTITPEGIRYLGESGVPLVWTIHDENPYTGFCHYREGCGGYLQTCENCPQALPQYAGLPKHLLQAKARNMPSNLVVAAPSGWIAKCARKSKVFRNNRVEVIPNGIDTDVFKPLEHSKIRAELGFSDSDVIILCGADSLDEPRKGFRYLAKAMEKVAAVLPGAILATFGKLELYQKNYPFRIRSLGRIDGEKELAKVYSAANVTAIPSTEDNLPNIMLESIACGTPLAGFGTGGIPDCVKENVTGFLAAKGDTDDLANALIKAAKGDLRQSCRAAAVQKYSLEAAAKNYINLYSDIANTARKYVNIPLVPKAVNELFLKETRVMSDNKHEVNYNLRLKYPIRDKYIIFGAGAAGQELAKKLPFRVDCYIDNNAGNIGEIDGVHVRLPGDVIAEKGKMFIIVATWKYSAEFMEQLDNLGLIRDVDYGDFREYDNHFPTITSLRVNATYRCNSRCEMCRIWENKDGSDLPLDDWKKIAGDPFFRNVENLYITGGETSLLPNFPQYVQVGADCFACLKSVSVVFNGLLPQRITGIVKEIKEICDKRSLGLFVSISIDGTEKVNDKQRGVPGGYNKAFETIELLKSEGVVPIVSTTISKLNVFDVENFLSIIGRKGLKAYFKPALQARFFNNDSVSGILGYDMEEAFQLKLFFRKLADFYKDEYFARVTAINTFFQLCGHKRLLSCGFRDKNAASVTETGQLKYCCSKSKELGDLLCNCAANVYQSGEEYLDFLKYSICEDCNADAFGGGSEEMNAIVNEEEYWNAFYDGRQWETVDVDLTAVGDTHGYSAVKTALIIGDYGSENMYDIAVLGGLIQSVRADYKRIIVASSEPFVTEYQLKRAGIAAEVIPTKNESYHYALYYAEKIFVCSNKCNPYVDFAWYVAKKRGTDIEKVDNPKVLSELFLGGFVPVSDECSDVICITDSGENETAFELGKIIGANPNSDLKVYAFCNTPSFDGRNVLYNIKAVTGLGFTVYERISDLPMIAAAIKNARKVFAIGETVRDFANALGTEVCL